MCQIEEQLVEYWLVARKRVNYLLSTWEVPDLPSRKGVDYSN
jgi:hypothetical protein